MMSSEKIFHIQEPWLKYLVDGPKKVEGRLSTSRWAKLKSGDLILCYSEENPNKEQFEVVEIRRYSDVRTYLETEGLKQCLPSIKSVDEGVNIYRTFYTDEQLAKHEFLAIELKYMGKQ